MENLTQKHLTSIILHYYIDNKIKTQLKLAEILDVDNSSISKWMKMKGNISNKNFKNLLAFLSADIDNTSSNSFYEFIIDGLEKYGFDRNKCNILSDKYTDISLRLTKLLENYASITPQLQNNLNTSSIISKLKSMFYQYNDFISISEQQLGQDDPYRSYKNRIYCARDLQDPTVVTEQNYLILNFPNSYRVAIVLLDYEIKNILLFGDSIHQLKEKNNIDLIIFFTDHEISFDNQKYLIENHNVFFETIFNKDLSRIRLQGVSIGDIYSDRDYILAQFHAQAIFEKFTSYFTVIRNEIIFKTYMGSNDSVSIPDKSDILKEFVDKILLKDVFKYSYLSRHSIYFERNRLKREVNKLLKHKKGKSLGIVVEICYPNSFLSSAIYENCDKLLLFTSSFHSYSFFNEWNKKNKNKLFPSNIQFIQSHIHPQYIANRCYNDITGKVDLVILGFGIGSNLINITEYLRHINSWLSPNGIIFISFANSDSAILQKQFDLQDYVETAPLFLSDYWQYSTDTLRFLARIKRYSLDESKRLISTYVDECKCCTYPFLSGIVNTTQNDKLLTTVRQIDKYNALKGKNKYGHYISIIGKKHPSINSKKSIKLRGLKLNRLIQDYLNESGISYEIIEHPVTIDTQSLFKTLLEKGVDNNQFDLVKTIILQKIEEPHNLKYCILPRNQKVTFSNSYRLMPEKKVACLFGKGSISPLVISPNIINLTKWAGEYYLIGFKDLTKEYTIFSSGISSESIKIKREIFINLMKNMGAIIVDSQIIQ